MFKFLFILFLLLLIPVINIAQTNQEYQEGQFIFKTTAPFTIIEEENNLIVTEKEWFNNLSQQYQVYELHQLFHSTQEAYKPYYVAYFDSSFSVESIVSDFENEIDVEYSQPDYFYYLHAEPNDFHYNKQWALSIIQAENAWDIESGSNSVIVGVIDSGTDLGSEDPQNLNPHPDLVNNLWNVNNIYGYNTLFTQEAPHDDNGHGTHVASIVAAT